MSQTTGILTTITGKVGSARNLKINGDGWKRKYGSPRRWRCAGRTVGRNRGTIDALLTDVQMPGLQGPELAKRVQELHPEVPVIYTSGYAQSQLEAQVPKGVAFLQKPFRLASLGEELKLVPRKV